MTSAASAPALSALPSRPTVERSRREIAAADLLGCFILVASAAPYLYGNALALLLVLSLLVALSRRAELPAPIAAWTLAIVTLGSITIFRGVSAGNTGAWSGVTVYVLEPLVLGIAAPLILRNSMGHRRVERWIDSALVAVTAVGLLLFIGNATAIAFPLSFVTGSRSAVVINSGAFATNYQGYNALAFLAPYGVVRSLGRLGSTATPARRTVLGACALLSVVLSSRSALFLSTPLALVALVLLTTIAGTTSSGRRARRRRNPVAIAGVSLALLVAVSAAGLGLQQLSATIRANATVKDLSGVRAEQSARLLEAWLESPVFGHGAAATVDGYVRSKSSPWQFELSWHVILLQAGLIGFCTIGLFVTRTALRLSRRQDAFSHACLAGLVGSVLAAATNPYFFKIEGIWMIFLPWGAAAVGYWRSGDRT